MKKGPNGGNVNKRSWGVPRRVLLGATDGRTYESQLDPNPIKIGPLLAKI